MPMNPERAKRPVEGVPQEVDFTVWIKKLSPNMLEGLAYCAEMCLADPNPDSLSYDCKEDLMIYTYKLGEMDHQAFPQLGATEEIWIVTDPNVHIREEH